MASRFTGVCRAAPDTRPLCSSTREPNTLIPRRTRRFTRRLKIVRVNQSGRFSEYCAAAAVRVFAGVGPVSIGAPSGLAKNIDLDREHCSRQVLVFSVEG